MSAHMMGEPDPVLFYLNEPASIIPRRPFLFFSPFYYTRWATTMAAYRCCDHCRELRKELNTMAGIYKPPIRLAILDYYAGQTGDLFKAEITALYTNALPLAKVGLPQFLSFLPIFCGDRASAPYRYQVG